MTASVLTSKEMIILEMIEQGKVYRDIAREMGGITEQTVKNHVCSLRKRLGAKRGTPTKDLRRIVETAE